MRVNQTTTDQLACSALSALFDEVILKRMAKMCHKNDIFNPTQFGFPSTIRCFDTLAKLTQFKRRENNQKEMGLACFVFLSEAFGTFVTRVKKHFEFIDVLFKI